MYAKVLIYAGCAGHKLQVLLHTHRSTHSSHTVRTVRTVRKQFIRIDTHRHRQRPNCLLAVRAL